MHMCLMNRVYAYYNLWCHETRCIMCSLYPMYGARYAVECPMRAMVARFMSWSAPCVLWWHASCHRVPHACYGGTLHVIECPMRAMVARFMSWSAPCVLWWHASCHRVPHACYGGTPHVIESHACYGGSFYVIESHACYGGSLYVIECPMRAMVARFILLRL